MAQGPARPLNSGQPSGLEAPPACSHPTGHTVAPAVPAPGPRVADGLPEHRRCGDRCQRASRHSHNWKTNIFFLRHTFRPAHTQDGTCETTSLSAWREENSLPNKSRGTFPKHTRVWQGAKGNALPRCMQGRRTTPAARTGGTEGAPQALTGDGGRWFSLSCQSWVPRGPCRHRETPHSSTPAAPRLCYRYWLPEKGVLFGKMSKSPTSSLTWFCRWAD